MMDTTYTTKRRLKSKPTDVNDTFTSEVVDSPTYLTSRKMKNSTAVPPEKGDCPEVSAVSADDGSNYTTKRKMKSESECKRNKKERALRLAEKRAAGLVPYSPQVKAAVPSSPETEKIRTEMKKYRNVPMEAPVSENDGASSKDYGKYADKAALSAFLVDTVTEEKSVHKPSSETRSAKVPSSDQNKETRSAAKLKAIICSKISIINYDRKVYAYTGRSYKLITNYKTLLNIVENRVDKHIFDLSSFKVLECVLEAMVEDESLIPTDYEKRLRESEKYLAFSNCLLNLETLQKEEFSPYWLITHELKARYVKNAYPRAFLKWLDSISDDEQVKRRIVEVLAVLLCGTNLTRSYFVCGTAPSAGKSTFAQLVKNLLGPDLVSSVYPSKMSEKFSIGSTKGKLVNLAMDLPKGKINDQTVSLIKSITGGDAIEFEMKYAHPEMGVSQLRFVFGTNFNLNFSNSEEDSAMWDRCVVVPFTRSIAPEDRNVHLLDDLLDEKDAIISYCAEFMQQVIANNY